MLQRTEASSLVRRVLIVDSALAETTNTAARSVRALVTELRARGIEVVEAFSCEDGLTTVVSDSAIHCVLLNWTQGATIAALTSRRPTYCARCANATPRCPFF